MNLATEPETAKKAPAQGLSVESILDLIRPGGRISQYLKGFEVRDQQQAMMRNVIDAYNDGNIALIEAGTGTGKSMAYLIPAILWAAKHNKRTVISTHTITLQEQLVDKDIPMLIGALGLQVKAELVKGMGNYVCLRKYEDTQLTAAALIDKEREELAHISTWLPTSQDGSRADMPIVPSRSIWDQIGAEPDTCNWQKCPFHKPCHFVKARAKATEAQILVVNHHLLFADLSRRAIEGNYNNPAVLPAYDHIIIDEAHNIEDVATEYFAARLSRQDSARLMARLASDRTGKLTELRQVFMGGSNKKNSQPSDEMRSIGSALNIDIPGQRRDLIQSFGETFQALSSFLTTLNESSRESDSESEFPQTKLRLLPRHLEHSQWREDIAPRIGNLVGLVGQYTSSIDSMLRAMEKLPEKELLDRTQGIRLDVAALSSRLTTHIAVLQTMASDKFENKRVRWIESFPRSFSKM